MTALNVEIEMDDARLPEPVRKRWKFVIEKAEAKIAAINENIGDERAHDIEQRVTALVQSRAPVRLKLRGLYEAAGEHAAFISPHAACRRGCSHCCHCAVAISRDEAELIGADIGRKPRSFTMKHQTLDEFGNFADFAWGYHNPCGFLKDGACSIYENRPLACRMHFNMDDDALLCELHPPLGIRVPMFNPTFYHAAYIAICGVKLADIREFFPKQDQST